MTRVCRIIPNFAGDSFQYCQLNQENINLFRKTVNNVRKVVNLFSKLTVNHIRKRVENCQPKWFFCNLVEKDMFKHEFSF